jgi:hypothetical protein
MDIRQFLVERVGPATSASDMQTQGDHDLAETPFDSPATGNAVAQEGLLYHFSLITPQEEGEGARRLHQSIPRRQGSVCGWGPIQTQSGRSPFRLACDELKSRMDREQTVGSDRRVKGWRIRPSLWTIMSSMAGSCVGKHHDNMSQLQKGINTRRQFLY